MPTVDGFSTLVMNVLTVQSLNVSAIFVVVLLATFLLRRRGPAIHLVLWSLVFVRLVLPPNLSHPWSLGMLVDRLVPSPNIVSQHEMGMSGIEGATIDALPGLAGERSLRGHRSAAFVALWLVGVAAVLSLHRRRLAPFHEVARRAQPVSDTKILEMTDRWRCRLRVRRRVQIVTSAARFSPFTIGVIHPIIFVPAPIASDRRSVEPVIAHEMVHVARWDALWLGVQHLVQAVYFFHPLVWIAGSRLDMERERLVDATVVAAGRIKARSYVGGLLNVLQLDLQGVGAPTMNSRKRRIDVRIQNILDRDGGARPKLAAAVAVACVLGVFVLPLGRGGAEAESGGENPVSHGTIQRASNEVVASFENPVPGGRLTWNWGPGRDPWTGEKVFHRGIDVAAKAGTPVLSPADGVVVVATEDFEESPASGTVIVVDHGDGWSTFFAHLGSLDVAVGERVLRSDVIGTVGSTGKSTGPHLHFEVRHDGEQLDPVDFVSDWK